MQLYRFEVTTDDGDFDVVICAKSDEHAFELVEIEIEKHVSKSVDIIDISLFEKKNIRGGAGFVIEKHDR